MCQRKNSSGTLHQWLIGIGGLFLHDIKIAFRYQWKYKSQTLINIGSLAIGLTCFALATLWIRYETSFDSSHKNANQMYVLLHRHGVMDPTRKTAIPFAAYLKESFPEIRNAAPLVYDPLYIGEFVTLNDTEIPAKTIVIDSNFLKMFDVTILEGSADFQTHGSGKMAVTREKARQLFGNKNPIGKKITNRAEESFLICAVVAGASKPSNYSFDFIRPYTEKEIERFQSWNIVEANTIIELFPGTDIDALKNKINAQTSISSNPNIPRNIEIMPLRKMRFTDTKVERNVNFQYVIVFMISGLLVVLCSLFNYFISMLSRFHIRQKELALRLVFGASGRSLLAMLTTELFLTLLLSVVLGLLFTQLLYRPFLNLSKVQMDLSALYQETLLYVGVALLVALLLFLLTLFFFRKRSLNLSIRRRDHKVFRKISIVIQLVISMVFIFCTCIIQKQMLFLHHPGSLGFSFHNQGFIVVPKGYSEEFAIQLKQIPEIKKVIYGGMINLLDPSRPHFNFAVSAWENKPANLDKVQIDACYFSPELVDFYGLQLLSGEIPTAADPESFVLINEEAAKAFGWHEPVGKRFFADKFTVKGVVKNVYNNAPTVPVRPAYYSFEKTFKTVRGHVLFEHSEDMWKSSKEKIERLIEAEYADVKQTITIHHSEEVYNKLLSSEMALIQLLSFFSVTCILICVFGLTSLVSLSCRERRKSIAIQKINGATSGDILVEFVKEYAWLLIIGSAIAFSIGYFIMQRWLEHYVKHTDIPVWIYLSIVFVMALVIILCIGHQVYKASTENPAVVINAE